MSMDRVAWSSLYNISTAKSASKPFSKETLKRVLAFAAPHKGKLIAFVLSSIVAAFLAVATPVLAGRWWTPSSPRPALTRSSGWQC